MTRTVPAGHSCAGADVAMATKTKASVRRISIVSLGFLRDRIFCGKPDLRFSGNGLRGRPGAELGKGSVENVRLLPKDRTPALGTDGSLAVGNMFREQSQPGRRPEQIGFAGHQRRRTGHALYSRPG